MSTATASVKPHNEPQERRVSILGSTGSIGTSTLDLIGRENDKFRVVALTGNRNAKLLAEQAIEHRAEVAVLADESGFDELRSLLSGTSIEAACGEQALLEAALRPADWTMAAITGSAGLRPTLEALSQGACLALANKECLVAAGEIFMAAVARHGATLLPVDSEHSAGFQAIDQNAHGAIEKITLTASGGPFRTWGAEQIAQATVKDALKHPNWSMGDKITIDSATLMNKGLEVIEAFHLFPVEARQLDVVIHPQSIVHCLVEYSDGAVLAQLSSPDMRTPIAYSLSWPERMWSPTERLDLARIGRLDFEAPDMDRFPSLRLAREALEADNGSTTVLNAANEIAVEAFLEDRITFSGIPEVVSETLEVLGGEGYTKPSNLDDVLALDEAGRRQAEQIITRIS